MVMPNGIYSLAVIGTVSGQRHIHTLHFRSTVGGTGLTDTEAEFMAHIVTEWQTTPQAAYRAIFGGADSPILSFAVRKVCGDTPLPAGYDVAQPAGSQAGTGIAGDFNGDKQPAWLANVVTERTNFSGRSYRGRFYLGGLYETMTAGDSLTTGRVTTTQNYCDALLAKFVTPGEVTVHAKLFTWSYKLAHPKPGDPTYSCQNQGGDVTSFQVRTAVATMKSRKAGSGT